MIILGIETSCDDTALALLETNSDSGSKDSKFRDGTLQYRVISSLVHSQAELHSAYGGVFPTLAKREHGRNIVPLFHKLLLIQRTLSDQDKSKAPQSFIESNLLEKKDSTLQKNVSQSPLTQSQSQKKVSDQKFNETIESFRAELQGQNPELFLSFEAAEFLKEIPNIDRIAVTEGPGLEPSLWVGINFARMLGELYNIPVVPIDHMEGHIVGSLLQSDTEENNWRQLKQLPLSALALLISGGHTELIKITNIGQYEIIGKTKDDAVGEAFDKVARLLELPYPGGPHISELAQQAESGGFTSDGGQTSVKLPRPMIHSGDLDFSFSGLKTAVLYAVRANVDTNSKLSDQFKKQLALEFELAVTETLDSKLRRAIEKTGAQSIIIGGGVAANVRLRNTFVKTAQEYDISILLPSKHVSGDNALMIALAAAMNASAPSISLKAHGTKKLG